MHQLDRMPSTAPTAATVSNMTPSRPTAALGGMASAGAFASTFAQVQHDVGAFIAQGGGFSSPAPAANGATPAMNLQAMALRHQGAGAIDGGADTDTQQQFLAAIKPWAEETAGKLGVSPDIVAAHAALESGWGRNPLRQGGADSNNLFGIKAGGGWQGAVAAAATTEFEHGAMLKKVERFRSYPDTASAFRDYAELLTGNPRYQGALNTGSDARAFAHGLAQGGYATDPNYADKLSKLAAQLQRAGGKLTASGN
ncbi:flagellar assembly peptidoglycan hydrolase FlgJ [Duganella sp. BJB488]|uniref:glycoside hydrolase family 73 protein n=2 Tax=Duganella TaxID=75654 RepID=UPI000E35768F|nr:MULTISPECIES: glucosaminidase domain-containing protein [unclassified Duganella]RFP08757.1 flagellar assembly peptidoglycan hydrolase FlgJ [Duganella sp. BJB489]RFP18173.1 flagellar assembly peptidoglycan hydrolase FlgJ [Duganella sp. BJB488]RFP37934.1 flagellar assembly peptidoglycan hydrolase FlgJ [Duganella sp. BJB480]